MNKDTKVFLLSPSFNVNALCADMLTEENFHSSLHVINKKTSFSMRGWEMTIEQLRLINKNAVDSGILGIDSLLVAVYRRDGHTLRLLRRDEWVPAEQHRRSLAQKIARRIINPIKNFLQ
jgi:hypothetical protein